MTEKKTFEPRITRANPVSISALIAPVLTGLGLKTDIRLEKLKKNWHDIVGAANARNTRPLSLRDGTLTVAVSTPVWVTQARFYSANFIKKINSFDPEDGVIISDIHFTLDRFQKE